MKLRIKLALEPSHIVIALIGIALGIAAVDLVSQVPRYFDFRFPHWRQVSRAFHMGREANIPTWYATILLFIAASLLAVVAEGKRQARDRYRWHWLALAGIFFYLSVDEASVLHEQIGSILGGYFLNSFLLFGGWVGFAVVGMMAFAIIFLPFWLALERPTKWLFALAGIVFVGGAMGVESLAVPYEMGRPPDFGWPLLVALEEVMELTGVAILIGALVDYIGRSHRVVELDFTRIPPDGYGSRESTLRSR